MLFDITEVIELDRVGAVHLELTVEYAQQGHSTILLDADEIASGPDQLKIKLSDSGDQLHRKICRCSSNVVDVQPQYDETAVTYKIVQGDNVLLNRTVKDTDPKPNALTWYTAHLFFIAV